MIERHSDRVYTGDPTKLHPWQERMLDERAQLAQRLDNLNEFLAQPMGLQSDRLSYDDYALLGEQRLAMTRYLTILENRIERFLS